MREILAHIRDKARGLSNARLFTSWLDNADIPVDRKFCFSAAALDFIMGFRDFNKYFIRYPNPSSELESALNKHAQEDETHSALLLNDWRLLQMDKALGWAPRDIFWWMTSDLTVESRRVDFDLTSLAYHNPNPLMRFAIIESMEAAGNVFFRRTVPTADTLEVGIGRPLVYFGRHHLERETGHLQGGSEHLFIQSKLSEGERAHACALVDRVFEVVQFQFDEWERFAQTSRANGWTFPQMDRKATHPAIAQKEPPRDVTSYLQLAYPSNVHGVNLALCRERRQYFERLWQMPFYDWIRTAWPGDFKRMVRLVLLQWTVDNWACADYFLFDTRYPNPKTPLELGINRLSLLFETEMKRRYAEWELLELDAFTGWDTADALEHYWLDEGVEAHREIFADLRKLTFRYPDPLHRYWIMKCFVRFGDSLMHSLRDAMIQSGEPVDNFVGFAGAPERLHPVLESDLEADKAIANLELRPVSAHDADVIREIMRATFEQEERRAVVSQRVIQSGHYHQMDQRWTQHTLTGRTTLPTQQAIHPTDKHNSTVG